MELNIRIMATTPDTRAKGLMHSDPLREDECAFFVFPTMDRYSFWNKNVPYKISLAFANESGEIVDFADLHEQQLEGVAPNKEAKFVVEAKYGFFRKNCIRVGDIVVPESGKVKIIKKT